MSRIFKVFLIGLLLLAGAALACSSPGSEQSLLTPSPSPTPAAISYYGYEVVHVYLTTPTLGLRGWPMKMAFFMKAPGV